MIQKSAYEDLPEKVRAAFSDCKLLSLVKMQRS